MIHKTTIIDGKVSIGDYTNIWQFCHIFEGATIGSNCVLGQGCSVASSVKIGNNCRIQNGVSIYDGVILEDNVFCGPHMVFTNIKNPRAGISKKHKYQSTIVRRGATIGANATIVCGITIGEYAFIGAGAVVTSNVPSYAMVYGNPSQIQGWVDTNGEPLHFKHIKSAVKLHAKGSDGITYVMENKKARPVNE